MDELLALAFEETAKDGYNSRMKSFPRHRFTFRFYRNMHKIFRMPEIQEKYRKKRAKGSVLELYRPIHSKRRLAVIVLLLLMIIGGSSFASEPFIRWLSSLSMEQNEDHVNFEKDENGIGIGSRTVFRKYCFLDIPTGYTLVSEKYDEVFQKYYATYVDSEKKVLYFKQVWQENEASQNLTSDTETVKDIEINGFTGYCVEDNGMSSLIISNGVYKLVLDGPFSKKELIELAGKLELSDDPIE